MSYEVLNGAPSKGSMIKVIPETRTPEIMELFVAMSIVP